MDGKVVNICISPKRGTEKQPVDSVRLIENYGLEKDAHAGNWHRQVSLLSKAKVDAFNEMGGGVLPGDFGENLLVEGLEVAKLPVGSRLKIGSQAVVEITQIGKKCHTHCTIYKRVNDCIMPREGVFAKVIASGEVHPGDGVQIQEPNRVYTAAVVVCSDKGSRKERKDMSGPEAARMLREAGFQVEEVLIVPDEQDVIESTLIRLADQRQIGLIVTSGGTGFSRRDVTPEATLAVSQRQAMGLSQAILVRSLEITDRAMLSRGVSVIRNQSVIVNLPGSPKGVREALAVIVDPVKHGISVLKGWDGECARP